MSKYRNNLPQLNGNTFLTDGGIETTLIFHNGFDLPEFAAFVLLENDEGQQAISNYYHQYVSIAKQHKVGFILESPTWRSSPDWGEKLGYSNGSLANINRASIQMLQDIRDEHETKETKMVISGCIGPRGDGYDVGAKMTAAEAEQYHPTQIKTFSQTEADMVTALTMTYAEEAIGVARAAKSAGIPVVISFTVETDGKLPSGQTLKDAIETVDKATDAAPVYYMINCAHPTHFDDTLATDEPWTQRIGALRANASTKSHAELDEAEELDDGNPVEFGSQYKELREKLSNLKVLGGCCGTDHRHVAEICAAYLS